MSFAVSVLKAVWTAASLAVGCAGGLFRRRRLPPTRHVRRVQLDLRG